MSPLDSSVSGEITINFTDRERARVIGNFFTFIANGALVASDHEATLLGRMQQLVRRRPGLIAAAGSYRGALLAHYGVGTPHPDDQNLPLN